MDLDSCRKNERFYQSLFNSIDEAFIVIEVIKNEHGVASDFRYLELNKAYERQTGVKASDVLGKNICEVFPGSETSWLDIFGGVEKTGNPDSFENYSVPLKKYYKTYAFPFGENRVGVLFRDITKRKQAEDALRVSEERFRGTMDNMLEGCQIIGHDWRYIYINKAAEVHNRRPKQELLGNRYMDMWPGIESTHVFSLIKSCMEERVSQYLENRFVYHDGGVGWFDLRITPVPEGVFILSIDITDRKNAEFRLKESEERFSKTFYNNQLAMAISESDGRIVDVNDKFENLFDIKRLVLVGRYMSDFVCYGDIEKRNRTLQLLKEGKTVEDEQMYFLPNGKKIVTTYFTQVISVNGKQHFFGMWENITERKKAEDALKASLEHETFLAALIRNASVAVGVGYPDGRLGMINQAFQDLTGYSEDELHKISWNKALTPVEYEEFEAEKLAELSRTKSSITYEKEYIRKDGSRVPIELVVQPFLDKNGNVTHYFSFITDITVRKKAQEALKESEQRWSTTLSSIGDAVIATDTQGKITFMNQVAQDLTGWSLTEASNKPLQKVFHVVNEETRLEVENPVVKVLKNGAIVGLANHSILLSKDGAETPIDDSGSPIKNSKGKVTGVVLVFHDITERKKADQALKDSEVRFHSVLDNSPAIIYRFNLQTGQYEYTSPSIRELGYNVEEIIAMSGEEVFSLVHPDDQQMFRSNLAKISQTGKGMIEYRFRGKDGVYRWFSVKFVIVKDERGQPLYRDGFGVDITQRKKSEEATQKQANLIDLSPDAIIVKKADDTITFWSKGAEELYGWTKEEAIGQKSRQLFKTVYPEPLDNILAQLKSTGKWTGEKIHQTKQEKQITVQSRWLATKDSVGRILEILETNEDITDRKLAEEALRRSEERFRIALNSAPVSVSAQDLDHKYIWAYNQRTAKPEEIIGKTDEQIFTLQEARYIGKMKERVIQEGVELREHMWLERPSGKIYIDVTWSPLLDKKGRIVGVTSATVDLTELKLAQMASEERREQLERTQIKLEESACVIEEYANQMENLAKERAEKLKEAERMAAIGQTAGMVGHDIRNPLQAITSDLYLIKEELRCTSIDKNAIFESADSIGENITYIDKIVSDLQDYTRPMKPFLKEIMLKNAINAVLLAANIPKSVETELFVDESLTLNSDTNYLKRILQNLVINALQAMPSGGKLTISTQRNRGRVQICVQDTGVGIPEDVKPNLFKPLYTTKSKGQGLGLAVVKRLFEGLDGTITFESKKGEGALFTLELPSGRF